MIDSIVPITLIDSDEALQTIHDNKWIESDVVAITIRDLREALENAYDEGCTNEKEGETDD